MEIYQTKFPFFFEDFSFIDAVDILIVYLIIYYIYKSVSKTRVFPVLQGFGLILLATILAAYFELNTLRAILEKVVSPMLISFVILFPSEIRKSLYTIGKRTFFIRKILKKQEGNLSKILEVTSYFSKKKIGSLMIIQDNDSLQNIIDTGSLLNANLNKNLLMAIFQKKSPLHDGAVIIKQNEIVAAACFIPNLSSSSDIKKIYGTRHRSALGLSELSDAFIIITSEETGNISLAKDSKIFLSITINQLKKKLDVFFNRGEKE